MTNKKKCFVIMPFSRTYKLTKEKWTEIFEHKIKPAVEESGCGYNCERYELRRANITKDILDELNNSHLVVADLTGSNPNVLWELGVRHTLSKRTILIAQDKKFLPSDLKDYPLITYKYAQTPAEVNRFRQDIKSRLKDIEGDPEKPDSPVADFLQIKNIDILAYEKAANLKKISALISEISYNINVCNTILKRARRNQQLRKQGKEEKISIAGDRFETCCLELLLSTHYVTLPKDHIQGAIELLSILRDLNSGLNLWQNEAYEEGVEQNLTDRLPSIRIIFRNSLKSLGKIASDYATDNYQEPITPPIVLSSPKHDKYVPIGK